MDPKETLKRWNRHLTAARKALKAGNFHEAREELAEATELENALLQWVNRGGFQPAGWHATIKKSAKLMHDFIVADGYGKAVNPRRNPVRHFPRTLRGRPEKNYDFKMKLFDKNDRLLVIETFRASKAQGEAKAKKALRAKVAGIPVARLTLDDGVRAKRNR